MGNTNYRARSTAIDNKPFSTLGSRSGLPCNPFLIFLPALLVQENQLCFGLVLERKYGTARHKPGCAVLRLIAWSRMFPRMLHAGVGGISRPGEDQRVT